MMVKKKGTISIDFLIGTILLVLGFGFALIIYFNLGGTGKLDSDICHESVLLRATLPDLIKSYVPLKCKTEKICITSGLISNILDSKECKDFAGEKGIRYMKVKSITEIEKVYAEEILKCWEMMGEGKISFFNQYVATHYGFGKVFPMCSICSRIAFNDKTITADNFDFSRMDVSRYMMTHKISGKDKTYFEYMASENGKIAVKENLFPSTAQPIPDVHIDSNTGTISPSSTSSSVEVKSQDISGEIKDQAKNINLQLEESAVLFMQISSPKHGGSITNLIKDFIKVELVSFILAPSLTFKADKALVQSCVKGWQICLPLAIIGVGTWQTSVAWNRAVTSGYCGDLSVGSDSREGCSAVRAVGYNLQDISGYCKVIESIA